MQQSEHNERLVLKQEINNLYINQATSPKPTQASNYSWTKDKKVLYSVNDTNNNTTANRVPTTNQASSPSDRLVDTNPSSFFKNQNGSGHRHRRDECPNNATNDSNTTRQDNNPQQQQQPANQTNSTSSSANTIIGHYQLKRTLGKGNFSTVKLAQHRITQHSVAIKVVKISVLSEDNLMKINREIEVLKKIGKHDHIVRLYQVIKTKRYFMLVTEYCPNGELYDYLVDKGKLSEPQSCNYFLQILSAVEYLHEHNVVHRDLKAENLLLTEDYKTIKIADFGFANYYKYDKLLSTWCGSPPYAAPELFKGLQYVGPPVDIWSMGVILYVMVCGSLPFDGHNLVYLKSRVLTGKYRIPFFMSTECEGLIRGMLRLDPERRFNVRQIKAHNWILKHSGSAVKKDTSSEGVKQNPFTSSTNCSRTNTNPFQVDVAISDASNIKNSDKNNNITDDSRGKSLDLDDDKKKILSHHSNEDSPMLCGNDDKSTSRLAQKDASTIKTATIQKFVDTEIANAVSNMSLDSNNSAMSVSQSSNTLSNNSASVLNSRLIEINKTETRNDSAKKSGLSKENSMDDHIIDYMVENLKVAETQTPIRQSIASDRYDDLHAMYRLIRDQPGPHFEAHMSAKFKIPSLPLILLNRQQSSKKPSITTGFFNAPLTADLSELSSNVRGQADDGIKQMTSETQSDSNTQCTDMELVSRQTDAMNLTSSHRRDSKDARQSDESAWHAPPQLFLTPPAECRVQDFAGEARKSEGLNQTTAAEDVASPTASESFDTDCRSVGRLSFDSTLQQLCGMSGNILDSSNNKLALTNIAKHSIWDSSILDNLSVSGPSQHGIASREENSPIKFAVNHGTGNVESALQLQNLMGITTNLPQIGIQQPGNHLNAINQNMYLAHLNSLALSAAVTQSSMLTQCISGDPKYQAALPIKFTPNNLMNQNYNVMNNLALQNTMNNPGVPNLSLLDPNGLISGFERRASDGQASYSSLTTNTNPTASTIDGNNLNQSRSNDNSGFQTESINTATTFLSSSSNQLSSDFHRFRHASDYSSLDPNIDIRLQDGHKTNNYNRGQTTDESMIVSNDANLSLKEIAPRQALEDSIQMNPLDLTKCSNETAQLSNQGAISLQHQNSPVKVTGQRSHSTTSTPLVFQHLPSSATTSPRNSLLMSSNVNNCAQISSHQMSPSSLSLTGGGPGHLLNRRKRHSLETETRNQHYYKHSINQQPGNHHQPYGPNSHFLKNYHDSNRSLRQSNNQQYLQYPLNSHIGQLRNFAQTFSYKKLMKKHSPPRTSWTETTTSQSPQNPNIAPDLLHSTEVEDSAGGKSHL